MKSVRIVVIGAAERSPSVWRVWIEIFVAVPWLRILLSPSVWRVWIEIVLGAF